MKGNGTAMTLRPSLTLIASAFAGGALGFVQVHMLGSGTTAQGIEGIAAGALLAGLVGIVHLFQPAPGAQP